jgi:NAD(P)-dependent dehydrogenase (short-subunit alcohol dehydrogenase family)
MSSILNHGTQQANTDLATLSSQQWHDVFDTNIHSFFYITKAAFQHMPHGSSIVYNASINMAVGHPELLDYTATKGAMIAFMRGLSNQIVGEKGIRVNGKIQLFWSHPHWLTGSLYDSCGSRPDMDSAHPSNDDRGFY